jgi:predicted CDP-diglyceride synthetase/phosphatidate cytidylyltransferase
MSKMTQQEKEDWDELYQYIKKDIFEYSTQSLPKYMILRLKGLTEGKFIANNNTQSMAKYEYKHILYTFKINKVKIKEIIKSPKFENEQHKFNTIMLLIEKEINDVVYRLTQKANSEKKIENIDLTNVIHEGAEYKNKSKNKKLNDLDELW